MKSFLNLTIGFQSRNDTYSNKLGFIIPTNEAQSNKNFTKWIDKKIPLKNITNDPISGFVFNKNIQRKFSYSTSEKMRVFHPEGFEFEITMNNLSFIIANANINAQEIMCDCVLGWFRGSVYLVPSHTEEGKAIIKQNQTDKQISTLSLGETIEIKKKEYIYLGMRNYQQVMKHTLFSIQDKNYHSFVKLPEYQSLDEKKDVSTYLLQLDKLDSFRKLNKKYSRKVTIINLLNFLYHEFQNNKPNLKTSTQELNYLLYLLKLISCYSTNFYFREELLYNYQSKNIVIQALNFNKENFKSFFQNFFKCKELMFEVVQVEHTFIFKKRSDLDTVKNISEYLNNDFSNLNEDLKILERMLTY